MTVVAYDGKTLAADRQATYGNTPFPVTKIFRVGNDLVAGSGDWSECLAFLEWYESVKFAKLGGSPPKPDFKEGFGILVIRNGELWRYERELVPFLINVPFWAIGSGADYALGAMACGKSAKEAVEIACQFDINCGLGVDVVEVDNG